jgi:hypothetical protein
MLMTTTEFPELTPEQKAYAAGWSDPAEARRRRIEALAHIVDALYPTIYIPGLDDEIYDAALRRAKSALVCDLAQAGALDGATVFDECGDPYRAVVQCLHDEISDPVLLLRDFSPQGVLLEHERPEALDHFADDLIEGYVGLPGTKFHGDDAIVELARDWLARTESAALVST